MDEYARWEHSMNLADASLDDLARRLAGLEEWARLVDDDPDSANTLGHRFFQEGSPADIDWDDYHRVRSEYDRRAAEEFDLGQ
jgi:hypothetical protein